MTSISSNLYKDISKSNSSWMLKKQEALSDREALSLAKLIKANTKLREVSLTCFEEERSLKEVGAGYIFNSLIPHKTIKFVDLSGNKRIGDQLSSMVAQLLVYNRSLLYLDIKDCGLKNSDAMIIGKALEKNKTLTKLLIFMRNELSTVAKNKLIYISSQRSKNSPQLNIS